MSKIVIAGGTGFIGTSLQLSFQELGHEVVVVSRTHGDVGWGESDLLKAIDGADVLINLAGKSINCRHNKKNKQAILDSRVSTTRKLGRVIEKCANPPSLWINASATGIYLPSRNAANEDTDTQSNTDFIATVIKKWEASFFAFYLPATRQVALRTSVVLGKNGGVMPMLTRLACIGLGGNQGSGEQVFSWIHLNDYFRIIEFVMQQIDLKGIVNCTSPSPISNGQLMKELRDVVKVRIGIPAPRLAIIIGAMVLGTESKLILNSSSVMPKRLLDAGFKFKFTTINKALTNLIP